MSYAYMDIENHLYPYKLKDFDVFFSELNCLDIIKKVLDEEGKIKNFPGIIKDERFEEKHRTEQCYDVRFEADFHALENGTYLMLWLIQTSGWYRAESDGFGFSGDSSVMLYSVIDENGNFIKEFELFSIDQTKYCHDFDKYLSK